MSKKLKICLAASAGGHLVQLLKISDCWAEHERFFVTTSEAVKAKLEKQGPAFIVGESNRESPFKMLPVLFKCISIIIKQRPDVVISTGAAHGCLLCLIGKILGKKIVWLDSIANTEKLSFSGRITRPFANLILTQWPEVAEKYNKVEYAGEVV